MRVGGTRDGSRLVNATRASHKVRHGRWVVGEGTRIIRRRGREWASETAERVKHSAVERCGCCCDGERVLIRAARRGTETGL